MEISPFNRVRGSLYLVSFLRYSMSKNIATLTSQLGSVKVIEVVPFDRLIMVSYLLVFYSNFAPFLRYSTWNPVRRSL